MLLVPLAARCPPVHSRPIVFMTANEVARETGWAMHGWADGDRATNEAFAPLETYGERFDALLGARRALGFDAIDLWGAHLSPDWATDEHVRSAREALGRHGLTVATYATWVGPGNVGRACELARAVGTSVIGGGFSGDAAALAPVLREHGVTLAIENHPERTPAEMLAKIEAGRRRRWPRRSTPAGGARRATTPPGRSRSSASTSRTCT